MHLHTNYNCSCWACDRDCCIKAATVQVWCCVTAVCSWLQCAARADKEPRCCRHMQPGAACSSAPGPGLQICLLNFWQLLHTSNTTSFVRDSSQNKTFFCLFCSHWSIFRHLVALFGRYLRHPLDKIWRLHYVLPSCSPHLSCSILLVTNTR